MKITILGCGNWGSAISVLLDQRGHHVTVWEFEKDRARKVASTRNNEPFLKGMLIPKSINITSCLEDALLGAEVCAFALPSSVLREVVTQMLKIDARCAYYLSLIKGIETKTLSRMSELIEENLGKNQSGVVLVLSGPCIANEVVRSKPTSVVVASRSEAAAKVVQENFSTDTFRIYYSHDVTGVELGGALKNVMAIACGICDGLELGDNARGALITRGIAEITRLGIKMGAAAQTFAGLSGVGDLITTATSLHSRNHYLGVEIGRSKKLSDILKGMVMVAEGVNTTLAAHGLAQKNGVEMPITQVIHDILFEGKSPSEGLRNLMTRPLKKEVV